MNTLDDLLEAKMAEVRLFRSDVFRSEESPGWANRHATGGVRFRFICNLCNETILDDATAPDLRDANWERLKPHLEAKHPFDQ